ncbi:unnamed protein product [Cyprideis torosa]|uniref:UDP-N-acetylglucosamine 4-epimerase n=1 Tax=Cyprideis torosa TaxID=163714 RepID=A0A7R8WV91_9CRUS|nr:unnamed protein product [Cyprideis torosa]CAG0907398.1 unnamed protein product [Cyprideis torosa]
MKPIQMVDLVSQYQHIQKEVDQAILDVARSSAYINGPEVKNFEKELAQYLGVKHVIACGNGTDALQVALMCLGLKPGDEVISTNFTFVATIEVIELLGLKSVLVDVDPDTFNIDVDQLEAAISPKTKAIIPVHLYGQCANMDAVLDIAKRHQLKVVEDTAQAIGAGFCSDTLSGKAGTLGDIGATSFFPSKNLGCYGDGGAIFTNDDNLAHTMRGIVNHGMYERYYHDVVGINSRLDSMQAAILRIKLRHLDDYNQRRQAAAKYYNEAFQQIDALQTPQVADFSNHVYHQYTLRIKNGQRDALKERLDAASIPNAIYYPVPMHRQKAYLKPEYSDEQFPVSLLLADEVLSLPMHTELSEDQLSYICETILVSGGLGYIGSHTVVALIESGFEVCIVDDLSNSELFILDRITKITGQRPDFIQLDLKDRNKTLELLKDIRPKAIIHFAASKAVGESMEKPVLYYQNNLIPLLNLCEGMKDLQLDHFVYSSSCTVYGQADEMPITEDFPFKQAESPYGQSKQMGEQILMDFSRLNTKKVTALRYFNPIGAHPSAEIGELPIGVPANLVPFITQTAAGWRKELSVFGHDYPTSDGTAVRDYIYIMDLANAHVAALKSLLDTHKANYAIYNLGTGKGSTVLEVIETFEQANDIKLAYRMADRRSGDIVEAYADAKKAEKELHWSAKTTLEEALKTAWEWQKKLKQA